MKICGVVVLYQPDQDVAQNIKSYMDEIDHLLVIDNSCEDNNGLFDNSNIEYYWLEGNKGLAYALDFGCRLANQKGYEYALTMDQDSHFDKGALVKMKAYVGQYSVIAPNVRSLYFDENVQAIKTAFIQYPEHCNSQRNWVMTSGSLVNLKNYKDIGGFDTDLFIAHIDIDYGLKLCVNKKKIVVIGDAILNQHFGNSKPKKLLWKTVHPSFAAPVRQYYIFRNQVYLKQKYGKRSAKLMGVSLWKFVVKAVLFEDHKWTRIKMMYQGYIDGKKKLMGEYREKSN